MRTKTLLLTAALGAASLATSMAQVYSVNSVGYINLTMRPGKFELVANQLNTGGNTLNEVLPFASNPNLDAAQCLTFVVTGGIPELRGDIFVTDHWEDQGGSPSTTTIQPGKGFFFFNPSAVNQVFTLVGEVPQGAALTVSIPGNEYKLISSIVPQEIDLTPANGFNAPVGTQYQDYDEGRPGGEYLGVYVKVGPGANDWESQAGAPVPAPRPRVGQGFYIFNAEPAVLNWTRCFNVNTPCQ